MNAKVRVIIAMLIFGSMGLLVRNINLSSSTIALARSMIGVVFLVVVSIYLKKQIAKKALLNNLLLLVMAGIVLSGNWIFLFQAYKHTSIATATLTYYLAPAFIAIFSPLVLKEKTTVTNLICIATSLLGMLLVSGVLTNPVQGMEDCIGIFYGIAAALSYASLTLLNKFIRGLSPTEATMAQLGSASVVLLLYTLFTKDLESLTFDVQDMILLIILGIVHTGIAFWLYFSSLQKLKAQTVAAFSYIDPVAALILSSLLLDEKMGLTEIVGSILILGSTLISQRLQFNNLCDNTLKKFTQ